MTASLFCCPVCKRQLFRQASSYVCAAGHSFDISRQGYVNLLSRPGGDNHGDNREMIRARRDFLLSGAYEFLSDGVNQLLFSALPEEGTFLDAGCGEGYYTGRAAAAFAEKKLSVTGVDISKDALRYAARRIPDGEFAVASLYDLPITEKTVSCVLLMFAPFCREELLRILVPGGHLIMAIPGEDHLLGMKEILYREPYRNAVKDFKIPGFRLEKAEALRKEVTLTDPIMIENLFRMTPYYYRTNEEGKERLAAVTKICTPLSFHILQYQKDE